MIQLQGVSKYYGEIKAVHSLSFTIGEGENFVLLGTSGCGKTTTLRMINRLTEPSEGHIIVNGRNIAEQPAELLRQQMGYVLQHNGLFPHYTVSQNIAIVPGLLKWNKQKTEARTGELLGKVGLPPSSYANLYPHQLSGGQQQRVGLARALAADPPVLLMDEPFGALDPVTRANLRNDFIHLPEFQNKTIVMVTHDVQEAFEIADRICLMDKGHVVQIGTPAELLFKPATKFVTSFLHDQHFILELKTITLNDIEQYLVALDNDSPKEITKDVDLWNMMQKLSVATEEPAYYVATNGQRKRVDYSSLLSAYTQFKIALQ